MKFSTGQSPNATTDRPIDSVPWSVNVYCLLAAATALSSSALGIARGEIVGAVLILIVVLGVAYFVWQGSRVAWSIAVVFPAIRLAMAISRPQQWWVMAIEVSVILLLVTPQAVRYVWSDAWEG